MDHFYSNFKRGRIKYHLNGILSNYEKDLIKIDKGNEKVFKKIISRMMKFNEGYWEKENLEFKILFYALKGIIENYK
ncbi:hypothetical protein ACFL6I_12230 [candidate division KSB1 bacterium]